MASKATSPPILSESWDNVDNIRDKGEQSSDTDFIDNSDSESSNSQTESTSAQKVRRRGHEKKPTLSTRSHLLSDAHTSGTYRRKDQRSSPRKSQYRIETGPKFIMPSPSQEIPHYQDDDYTPTKSSTTRSKHKSTKTKSASKPSPSFDVPWKKFIHEILGYILPIISGAMNLLKPIFSVLLAALLLVSIGGAMMKKVTDSLSLCQYPMFTSVTSFLHMPICDMSKIPQKAGPVEFEELISVQSQFEEMLSASARGSVLPLEMKHTESSIRDLRTVVEYSSLPSRNELVFEFNYFIDSAREASMDLTLFNARIGRVVDFIISVNRWTLNVIDSVEQRERSKGSAARFLNSINIFSSHNPQQEMLDQFLYHTYTLEERINELIIGAQAMLGLLQSLDERLDIIANIAARDGYNTKGSRDELLATLWVKLGGKRDTVGRLEDQLALLRQVGTYRKMAWAHVSGTVLQLQSMAAALEDLRERVAAPEVAGVKDGLPMRVHIENIYLGVERLETQRWATKRLENEMQRKILMGNHDY